MADNPSVDPGPSPTLPVQGEDLGGGVILQEVAVRSGAHGSSSRVSTANPLPISDAGGSLTVDGTLATTSAAASQADGHSATIGATADASSALTLVGLLKAIKAAITGTLTVGLPSGAATAAKQPALGTGGTPSVDVISVQGVAGGTVQPVSDGGGSLTVDGTVGVSGSVAVTGPLTDTQLRATAVPVSGTVTATPTGTQAVSHAAAAQADGHSANIGLLADASSSNTLTGLLKAIKASLAVLPASLGQKTMANGLPVTIASDQSAIPVSGTIAVSGTMPTSSAAASQVDGHSANIGTLGDASSASTLTGLLKNIKAALASALTVVNGGTFAVQATSVTLPTGTATIGDGRQVVTTAGTSVQFSSQTCKQVTLTALSTNTGIVVLGASTVVASAGTRRGVALFAGDSVTLDLSNLNLLYIDSMVNGEGVSFLWEA